MEDRQLTEAERAFRDLPQNQDSLFPAELTQAEVFNGKAAKILRDCAQTGEPVFIFRAKDIFSVMVIAQYLKIVEEYAGNDHVFQEEIGTWLEVFKQWQRDHPDRVRYPD